MAKTTSGEMPFLDHLEELRWRIVWSLAAIVVGLIAGFYIVVQLHLIKYLQAPIAPYLPGKLVITSPMDTFSITMNFSILIGVIIASPVIIYQAWAFLSPALHKHEKKVVIPVIMGAVGLFVTGVGMAWFFVLPMILKFLLTFQSDSFDAMITASGYFGMVTTLSLTFGAAFELPMLVLALAALGLVTPALLSKLRPYALVLTLIVSAIVTPGDVFLATIALAAPLYFLYEASILLTLIIFRKKRKAAAAEYADDTVEGLA